jgi:ribose 5-phosphate isomerase A
LDLAMTKTTDELDRRKAAAAEAGAAMVEDGLIVGLGSGTTASIAIGILGQRVAQGLRIIGIPTSTKTERNARHLGIPLSTLAEHPHVDVTLDGADEVEIGSFTLLKGRGGALLREKVVASASAQLIILVDETKLVDRLGLQSPVAVEVVPFGWGTTARRIETIGASIVLRTTGEGEPFVTDNGNYILDCAFGTIDDPERLQRGLDATVGIVEHGLFLGMASKIIVGTSEGVEVVTSRRSSR